MMPLFESPRMVYARLSAEHASGPYLAWMNDPEVMRYLVSGNRAHTAEDLRAFIDKANRDPHQLLLGMFAKEEGRHVGNIKLDPADMPHKPGQIGLVVGDRFLWGKGFGSEAINAMSLHAFRTLGLHKVVAGCYQGNEGSRRAFLKAGFVEEGVRRQHFFWRGGWIDEILLGRIDEDG